MAETLQALTAEADASRNVPFPADWSLAMCIDAEFAVVRMFIEAHPDVPCGDVYSSLVRVHDRLYDRAVHDGRPNEGESE